jgi:hypothetical protein
MLVKTERVSEVKYLATIKELLLQNKPAAGQVMMVMLTQKLGSFTDPVEPTKRGERTSPLFVYDQENIPAALEVITEWAEAIANVHMILPRLTVLYFYAILSEEEFNGYCTHPETIPADQPDLKIAFEKYALSQKEVKA